MGLAIASFARSLFSPPASRPMVREPNRRWARGLVRPQLLRLKVARVVEETPSTRTFVFEDTGIDYRAGQHLTVVAEVDGKSQRRCYSFSSSPLSQGRPSITVKRVEGGVLSNWLHDHVRTGDVLRALPAAGRFTVNTDAQASRHLVMVAGGVGITPLISMAETVLREEVLSRVTLLYGSRCESEIIFRDRLDALAGEFSGRFEVALAVDEAPHDWSGLVGRLDGARAVALLRDCGVDQWFVCGPQPLMDTVVAALGEAGVEEDSIHLERFQYAEASAATRPTGPATLVFAASGVTATAAPGTTLLDAAELAGITLPSSCRMGGCGACKVKVDGNVVSAEPNCLTPGEKAEGYALACCSWGDGRVVLRDF
jgi:ferredoxin-NADP reductase